MQPKNSPKGEFFNDIALCSMISPHNMRHTNVSFRGNGVTVGIQPSGAPTKQALARNCGLSFCPSHIESEEGLRG